MKLELGEKVWFLTRDVHSSFCGTWITSVVFRVCSGTLISVHEDQALVRVGWFPFTKEVNVECSHIETSRFDAAKMLANQLSKVSI